MTENEQDTPKIIIDDDWKAQAQAEKERLTAEQKAAPADEGAAPAAPGERPPLPDASFSTLVTTTASQTLFALGAVPDPQTQKTYVDLDLARYHIDTLRILDEKTAGNLTDEEKALLDSTLYELRTHFMRVSQQLGA